MKLIKMILARVEVTARCTFATKKHGKYKLFCYKVTMLSLLVSLTEGLVIFEVLISNESIAALIMK